MEFISDPNNHNTGRELPWYTARRRPSGRNPLTSPKPSFFRRVESRVRYQLGLPFPWVQQSLLGHDLVLRAGTLRDEPDYDDAWLFACLKHADVMFDVGANVGQSALMALLCRNIKQVVLVEANWEA